MVLSALLNPCLAELAGVLQAAVMQACGHLYLDEGEELEVGQSRENLLAFEAFTTSNSSGQVRPASAILLLVSIQIAITYLLRVN